MNFDSHINEVVVAAVALVNAVTPGRRGGRAVDVPTGPALAAAVHAALAVTTRHPPATVSEIDAAGLARWAARLRAVVEHVDTGDADAACTALNRVLRDAGAVPTLSRHDGEPWHLHFHRADAPLVESWAAAMATGLATVLSGNEGERLGVCHAEACDRLYADTSRNATRRFCGTACQNRVKAAAFRA